jgi:hypothetical protein
MIRQQTDHPIPERSMASRPCRDLVRPVDGQIAQQIRPDLVFGMRHGGPWPLVDGFETHLRHQPTHALAPDDMAKPAQIPRHLPTTVPRRVEKLLIDQPHQRQVQGAFAL